MCRSEDFFRVESDYVSGLVCVLVIGEEEEG